MEAPPSKKTFGKEMTSPSGLYYEIDVRCKIVFSYIKNQHGGEVLLRERGLFVTLF